MHGRKNKAGRRKQDSRSSWSWPCEGDFEKNNFLKFLSYSLKGKA